MPIVNMLCPRCGKQATEYDKNKWRCLICNNKFIYEAPIQPNNYTIEQHIHHVTVDEPSKVIVDEPSKPKIKWYFTNYWVVIALLSFGPFALPLIWFHPRYKPATKWIITVLVIIATIWISIKSVEMYQSLQKQLQQMQRELGGII